MRLKQVLSQVQHTNQLSRGDNLVFDFFIKADGYYLHKAKAAIRKLYRKTYGYLKSVIIPHIELIKFIIDTLPAVIKVLMIILPLILQREYKATKCD